MPTLINRTERAVLAAAAAAFTVVTLSWLTSGFLPADPGLERARAERLLARSQHVQDVHESRRAGFQTASVTTIIR